MNEQEPVSALSNLRVPIERINEIQGDLMAYYSSGAQAPKDLLFAASDCIGAILFDLIDAKRGHPSPVPASDISQKHEPSRTQTKQIVDGLQRCHHPDSQHEFLRAWIRDWTIHKTAPREWVGLTDEEMDELVNRFARYGLAREIESKLKEKNHG